MQSSSMLRCMASHGEAVARGEILLSQAFRAANYSLRTQARMTTTPSDSRPHASEYIRVRVRTRAPIRFTRVPEEPAMLVLV